MMKIDKLDVINIKRKADTYNKSHTELRDGQALYLAASDLFPRAVGKLNGTKFDCFYEDSRMEKFLLELQTMDAE